MVKARAKKQKKILKKSPKKLVKVVKKNPKSKKKVSKKSFKKPAKKAKIIKAKPKALARAGKAKIKSAKLLRALHNPIISPRAYSWESKATFNPAAFISGGKVHIIYRAIGDNDTSVLGYAGSLDGFNISERPSYFIYNKMMGNLPYGKFILYDSGGGWNGGCEDPRLALIDDTVYMIYTAFDGWGSLRIALTSIKLADFEKKKWNWDKPKLISPPGEIHKNWVIFPEKINGKFAILHNISPDVLVDYVDSLDEFDGTRFIKSRAPAGGRDNSWDSWVRGAGPTPIKTELGWLLLYHAMDNNDPNRYKLGAMILDSKDPTKVLYRSHGPILEPDVNYENEGWKWGVVYSCGAVVKDGELIVYYGGADKVVCVASISLAKLLEDLKKHKTAHLHKNKMIEL